MMRKSLDEHEMTRFEAGDDVQIKKPHEKASALCEHGIFAKHHQHLPRAEMEQIVSHFELKTYHRSAVIWSGNQEGTGQEYLRYTLKGTLAVIALTDEEFELSLGSGSMAVSGTDSVSKQQQRLRSNGYILSAIKRANFLGLGALSGGEPLKVKLVALTDVVCLEIDAVDLRKWVPMRCITDLAQEAQLRAGSFSGTGFADSAVGGNRSRSRSSAAQAYPCQPP